MSVINVGHDIETAVKSIYYCDRKVLAYSLRNTINIQNDNYFYVSDIFEQGMLDKIVITDRINEAITKFIRDKTQPKPYFNVTLLTLLYCLKHLSLKEKIKIVYMYLNPSKKIKDMSEEDIFKNYVKLYSEELVNLRTLYNNNEITFNDLLKEKNEELERHGIILNNTLKRRVDYKKKL